MRIESLGNLNIKPELLEVLRNLEVGDIIKGRLVDFLDNTVTVKTTGGHTITAALMADVSINKGDFVQLMINNITSDKIFVQLNNEEKTQISSKMNMGEILNKLEIPINENSLKATELLLKNNMPVNKDTLLSLLTANKSTDALAQSSTESKLALMLLDIDIKNTDVNILNKASLIHEPEVKAMLSKLVENQTIKNVVQEGNIQRESSDELDKTSIVKSQIPTQNDNSKTMINAKATSEQIKSELVQVLTKLQIPLNNEVVKYVADIAKALATVSNSKMEELAYLQSKDFEITPNNLESIKANINNSNKLDDFLSSLQKQIDVQGDKQLKELKDDIKRIFLHPKQVENKEEIKEKLKDIIKLGEKIDNVVTKQNLNETEIRSTLINLRENISFINHINQYNNYLQLPLVVNGEQSTADLYVFKDKKRGKNIDPQNATILLALDLKSLGHLESLVSVSKKAVSITFRIENKDISDMLKKHSPDLINALEAKGFTLNPVKYIKLEQSFNLLMLEDMITDENSELLHFDTRI